MILPSSASQPTARAQLRRRIVCAGKAHALLTHQARLPIETEFAEEVAQARLLYPCMGQVMALENRGDGRDLACLVSRLWAAIGAARLDAVLIAVDPGDVAFYARLGFTSAGWPRRAWLLADDAEVEVMILDVAEARGQATDILNRLRSAAAGCRTHEEAPHA